jgi:hypothetical protein
MRDQIVLELEAVGLSVERSHHEVGTAGQGEINYRFDTLVKAADDVLKFKYVVKNVANAFGKTATFMPKPLFGDNGSGMHVHQSLWKGGQNLFSGNGYAGLSELALYYIGGIIKHARALNAITNPGNIDAVEKAAMEELNRFIELGPTEAELVDAKKAYLESRKIGRASDAAIAGQLASNLDLGRTMAYVAEEEKQIANLTVADVQKAFKKYIDPKRLVIIRAGDFKK